MKVRKKIFLIISILGFLALIFLLTAKGGVEVETVTVDTGTLIQTVEDSGHVQPVNDYLLYTPQNARVTEIAVEIGEPVKKGQTLLVLENSDLDFQINETQSHLAQARATAAAAQAALERTRLQLVDASVNLARKKELLQAGATTQTEYDQARLLVETYKQTLEEQNNLLEGSFSQAEALEQTLRQLLNKKQQLIVKSPADGLVLNLPVQKNQSLTPGVLIARVAKTDILEIKAAILSDDLAPLKPGQMVTVSAPVLGTKTLAGQVKKIYPQAEEKLSALGISQRRVPVIISLEKPDLLKPGYEVKITIEILEKRNVLLIPREAVYTTAAGTQQVAVVVNNRITYRPVKTGLKDKDNIEIIEGLKVGEQVVKDGSLDLAENSRVKPINK